MGAIDADSGNGTAPRNDRILAVMILAVMILAVMIYWAMIFKVMIFGVVVRRNSTSNLAASHHRATPRITAHHHAAWHSTGIS